MATVNQGLIGACILLFLVATASLFRAFGQLRSFDLRLRGLPRDVPGPDPFDGKTPLGRAANEYSAMFSTAASKNILGAFRPEHSAAPVQAALRSLVSTPRSIVGVLILGGLLVTLSNLQGSVKKLGDAFRSIGVGQVAISQGTADDTVRKIQEAMGDIAEKAQSAFTMSGYVIFGAAIILFSSIIMNVRGQRSSREFAVWAETSYLVALADRPVDQHAQLAKFAELIDKMATVVGSFDMIGTSMASVGELGSKLDLSSQVVADAVSQLPATINASVLKLSADVANDFSSKLASQMEYMKKIYAVFGAQEDRVRKLQEYLDAVSKSTEANARVVAGLGLLPASLEALSRTLQATTDGMGHLVSACTALAAKVDDLPNADIRDVINGLELVRRELPTSMRQAITPKLDELAKTLDSLSPKQVLLELRGLRDSVQRLPVTDIAGLQAAIQHLERTIQGGGQRPTSWWNRR